MASLKSTPTFVPAYGLVSRVAPYVQCVTTATTVGWKNVTLFVDSFVSLPYGKYRVSCKAGAYGHDGELCSSCMPSDVNATSVSGMSCPYDDMKDPIALPGKTLLLQNMLASPSCSTCLDDSLDMLCVN
jgi:hypothetical protein